MTVTVYIHVCKKYSGLPFCGYRTAYWNIIVTRGPPSV